MVPLYETNMAIEKPVANESQIALTLIPEKRSRHYTKNHDHEPCLFRSPADNCVIIIDDDDEEETLESRKKKNPRLGSWWDYDDAINEPCSFRSPTDNCVIIIDDDEDEETLESRKKKKPRLGSWWDYDDAINELSIVVKGLTKPKHDNKIASRVDNPYFSSSDLHENKKTNDYDKRSSPTSTLSHEVLCVDENVGCENPTTSLKGKRHVSLEELGVSVEDLKSMPLEAFDTTLEIRSETMDPCLDAGYNIQDLFSPHQLLTFPPIFRQFSS